MSPTLAGSWGSNGAQNTVSAPVDKVWGILGLGPPCPSSLRPCVTPPCTSERGRQVPRALLSCGQATSGWTSHWDHWVCPLRFQMGKLRLMGNKGVTWSQLSTFPDFLARTLPRVTHSFNK